MLALLIIPLLVSGYILLTTHPYHYYRLHRYDGQLLYMKSAAYGLWCLVWTLIIAYLIKWQWPSIHLVMYVREQLDLKLADSGSERIIGWIILLSCGSIFLAYTWGKGARQVVIFKFKIFKFILRFVNGTKFPKTDDANIVMLGMRQELVKDNPLDEMFFDSLVDRKTILFTLQNKKVYVGIVNALGEPNEKDGPNQHVSILPIMSGHRDKDTLSVILKNEYKDIQDKDTSIVFPLEEISQVSWFDMDTHLKVKQATV